MLFHTESTEDSTSESVVGIYATFESQLLKEHFDCIQAKLYSPLILVTVTL